jgi:hypothetical protein
MLSVPTDTYEMPNPQRTARLLLPRVPGCCALCAKGALIQAQWEARRQAEEREVAMATTLTLPGRETKTRRNPRGVFEKHPGSGEWWICYWDAQGRKRREKAGTKSNAIDLYRKRENEALQGKKLPEKLRKATVAFTDIAKDALAYSKLHKRSHHDDGYRMAHLVDWFGSRAAESITPQDIEQSLSDAAEENNWLPGTVNRHRSLLSLTYRLAIRNGKVRENPVGQVPRKRENNIRTRFLEPEEEASLRAKIRALYPAREPEFDLALHTGMRRNEQWKLRWQDVNPRAGIITIPQVSMEPRDMCRLIP